MQGDLSALIERVENATGPDRELDVLVALAVCGWADTSICNDRTLRQAHEWRPRAPDLARAYDVPLFTSSLDAALALVEEKLPGANWRVAKTGGDWRPGFIHGAHVQGPYSGRGDHEDGSPRGDGDGATPALAVLSALLRALSNGSKEGA